MFSRMKQVLALEAVLAAAAERPPSNEDSPPISASFLGGLGRSFVTTTVTLGLALASSAAAIHSTAASFPTDDPSVRSGSSRAESRDEKALVHVLNRVGFGPRGGDVATVREIGLQRYIDQQLHPERIADEGMSARLSGLKTIAMSGRQIAEQFEIPQLEMRQARRQQAARAGNQSGNQNDQQQPSPQPTPEMQQRANQVVIELSEQKLLRAVYSERQLQEVLTDFWFNHFNVDARKGRDRFMVTEYEREAIRPHVLGRFRDLLGATAKSPAMLFYLDNWQSADPNGPHVDPRVAARRQRLGQLGRGRGRGLAPGTPAAPNQLANRPARGLNENYGRELMELHTLGVNGGYTQKDVTEVARAFTGWTIDNPRQGGSYRFEPRIHDEGEKNVLGHVIKAGGGERDGEQVLDILASQPSTAHFIATKLVRRFVSDTPPPSLVDRATARFRETDGDLREVMRTILTSSEFLSPDAYRAKVKTPFEFVVSAMRVTGTDVQDGMALVRAMQQLGMPLYLCQPPTGYKDTADAWVNTGALVNRMNIALALAGNQLRGIAVPSLQPPASSPKSPASSPDVDRLTAMILNGDVSESTMATISKATTASQMAALTLGSPEFQRR